MQPRSCWASKGIMNSSPIDLDNIELYSTLDPSNLRQRLRTFPLQCQTAWDEAEAMKLPREYGQVKRVVVAGMGGSAIGGDLLADLVSLEKSVPIAVYRDYDIPSYVDETTLILACSYSGNTEETLSAFQQATKRGAKVVAITSGGMLGAQARDIGLPVFTVSYPGEPRSALGYSLIVPMVVLMKLGLLASKERDIEEAVELLTGLVPGLAEECPTNTNPAKALAKELQGRLIVVYGSGIFSGVARRWKSQFNENSKAWAFFELLPEAHHNSVVGYSMPQELRDKAFVLLLKPSHLHPRTSDRYRVTKELLTREGIAHRQIEGWGSSPLSQMLSVVLLGDYVSYYLALLQGVDPSPVATLDFIKSRMG